MLLRLSHGVPMSMSCVSRSRHGRSIRTARAVPRRRAADHVLLTTLVASALPHLFKFFLQQRPDRRTVRGHWRGVPFSGRPLDAFPSGHAVHVGALASAASRLPRRQRDAIWLLRWRPESRPGSCCWRTGPAMWLVGLAIGTVTERSLRKLTGYGRTEYETGNDQPSPCEATHHEHAARTFLVRYRGPGLALTLLAGAIIGTQPWRAWSCRGVQDHDPGWARRFSRHDPGQHSAAV